MDGYEAVFREQGHRFLFLGGFLIAHRLSTIRDADRIMVIGDGKILESGNHRSLMGQKGQYYNMVISQMGKLPEVP
jgi:ATP-binding cassette subfamily B protein